MAPRDISTRLFPMKFFSAIAVGAVALACIGSSAAQAYRPDEFLTLDLSHAVLSPNPLGPVNSFAPGPLDVTVDHASNTAPPASAEFVVEPKTVTATTVHVDRGPATRSALSTSVSGRRGARARVVARSVPHAPRAPLALHRRNPVEAQARDTSIQVWPCRSGGICNWKR